MTPLPLSLGRVGTACRPGPRPIITARFHATHPKATRWCHFRSAQYIVRHLKIPRLPTFVDTREPSASSRALMKNPDDQDIDPDDIFEELEPTEPESTSAQIRDGEEVDIDELTEEDIANLDWDEILEADRNYVDYLEEKKPEPSKPPEQP